MKVSEFWNQAFLDALKNNQVKEGAARRFANEATKNAIEHWQPNTKRWRSEALIIWKDTEIERMPPTDMGRTKFQHKILSLKYKIRVHKGKLQNHIAEIRFWFTQDERLKRAMVRKKILIDWESMKAAIGEDTWRQKAVYMLTVRSGRHLVAPAFLNDPMLGENMKYLAIYYMQAEEARKGHILAFLTRPHPLLNGATPVEAISRGQHETVKTLAIKEGAVENTFDLAWVMQCYEEAINPERNHVVQVIQELQADLLDP